MATGELPTGTVTFLFTDIESSTALLKQLGDAYRPLLERHYNVIRIAIAAHDGVEVKTEGDAVFAAFADATQAALACVDAQRALQNEPWPDGAAIRVRMGLHTGSASPIGGDYVALAVHQAARVADAPHGNQVVASSTTVEMAGELPSPAEWMPIGLYELRDFDGPEPLFQIAHPDLEHDFPALRVRAATMTNLPAPRTTFVGREEESETLRGLLAANRLVTVVGAGGAGKTRLAMHAADNATDAFPDGVWLTELAPVREANLVVHAILDVLGIRPQSGEAVLETLLAALRSKHVLLVIDNCEHVLDAAADVIDSVLARCPDVKILATSREPLNVAGEAPWRLPSLDAADGARLFIDRARAANPEFVADPDDAVTIAAIVRRLDGIPLAVELAASRVRALTVRQVAQRLDDRFALLAGGPRSALPRQQTLRAAVDWSFDLLNPHEQELFCALSLFVDGFDLEAAEIVGRPDCLDQLESLVDKSLVVASSGRFRMLETLRHYGRERLVDRGEAVPAQLRFAQWAHALLSPSSPEGGSFLAERIAFSVDRETRARIETEHDNLLAAFDAALTAPENDRAWAIAIGLSTFWWLSSRCHLGLDRLADLRDRPGTASDRYKTFFIAQELALGIQDWPRMRDYCDGALELRTEGDPGDIAGLVFHRAVAAESLGAWDESIDAYALALEMAQTSDSHQRESIQYSDFAARCSEVGSFDLAERLEAKSIAAAEKALGAYEGHDLLHRALVTRAGRLHRMGQLDEARAVCARVERDRPQSVARTSSLRLDAANAAALGLHDDAVVLVEKAAHVAKEIGKPPQTISAILTLATLTEDAEVQQQLLSEALSITQQIGHRPLESATRSQLALVLADAERHDDARREADAATALATATGDHRVTTHTLVAASAVAHRCEEIDVALQYANRALDTAIAMRLPVVPRAFAALADALETTDLVAAVRVDGAWLRWEDQLPSVVWPPLRDKERANITRRVHNLGEPAATNALADGRNHEAFEVMAEYRARIEAVSYAALDRAEIIDAGRT